MNIVKSHIQWNLTYEGEVMFSPLFSSYEECRNYIESAPKEHDGKYQIVSRIVVTETSPWQVWA